LLKRKITVGHRFANHYFPLSKGLYAQGVTVSSEEVFPIFIGVWVVLGLISFLIFFVSKNADRKKKLWAPFIIFTGVLFIGFTYLMGFGGQHLYIMVPMVVLISLLNIRSTKFCNKCGVALE
jgi:hypothetical protein